MEYVHFRDCGTWHNFNECLANMLNTDVLMDIVFAKCFMTETGFDPCGCYVKIHLAENS